jgi:transcriptional regulator with XRE-family HTH domain
MSIEQNAQPIEHASQQPSGRRFRGWRLSCLRKERGLSLQDVADKLKLSKSKYYAFERGKQDLPVKKLEKLQQWFEISPEEVKSDAQSRSREIAIGQAERLADKPQGLIASDVPGHLPWMRIETEEQKNSRIARDYGSVENYLRISAQIETERQRANDFQMELWDAREKIAALERKLADRDRREERIKKTLNSAFYGE